MLLAGRFVHARRGCYLDDFLVAALQRAIALEQMDDITVGIAENLHLDMARALDVFFDQDIRVASAKSAASSTLRIPFPLPPATALMRTG